MGRGGSKRGWLARAERRVIGAGMRLIAIFAERKVRHSLEDAPPKRRKRGLHVDIEDR